MSSSNKFCAYGRIWHEHAHTTRPKPTHIKTPSRQATSSMLNINALKKKEAQRQVLILSLWLFQKNVFSSNLCKMRHCTSLSTSRLILALLSLVGVTQLTQAQPFSPQIIDPVRSFPQARSMNLRLCSLGQFNSCVSMRFSCSLDTPFPHEHFLLCSTTPLTRSVWMRLSLKQPKEEIPNLLNALSTVGSSNICLQVCAFSAHKVILRKSNSLSLHS